MKKIFSVLGIILLAAVVVLSSCSKDEKAHSKKIKELRFNVKVVNKTNSSNTKVVKTDWENGDKIFVYFPGVSGDGSEYATLTYDGTSWTGTIDYDSYLDPDNLDPAGGVMKAVHFPFGNVVPDYSGTYVIANRDDGNAAFDDVPVFSYYMVENGSVYTLTVDGDIATLTGTLNMTLPDGFVYFYIDAVGDNYKQDKKYRLAVDGVKPASIVEFGGTDFEKLDLGFGQPMWGYKYGDGIAFAGIIDDTWATAGDHQFIFFSDGDPAMTKTFTGVTLSSHGSIKLKAPVATNGWNLLAVAPTYTQMADGTKWGDWNLMCAGLNDDPYTYDFRWNDIVPNGNGTHYSFVYANSLTGVYAIYDAARAILGSNWRMPTTTEFGNFSNDSNRSVHASGHVTGGDYTQLSVVFTNKYDDTKSVAIPVADGSAITYWTSTYNGYMKAHYWQITNAGSVSTSTTARDYRRAIRPVYVGE